MYVCIYTYWYITMQRVSHQFPPFGFTTVCFDCPYGPKLLHPGVYRSWTGIRWKLKVTLRSCARKGLRPARALSNSRTAICCSWWRFWNGIWAWKYGILSIFRHDQPIFMGCWYHRFRSAIKKNAGGRISLSKQMPFVHTKSLRSINQG